MREEGVRRSVELRDGDDVVAVPRYVQNGIVKGRLTAAYTERAHSAFKQGDSPFEHVAGGVADPAVAVPLDFEIEQSRPVLSAVEGVGNGLIDGHGDCLGRRVNLVTAVNGERFVRKFLGATPCVSISVQHDCSRTGAGKSDNLHLRRLASG